MKTITYTCETITPLFLAGADGTTPELRAPSVKGALRFWWRAMNGHLPLSDLRKQETKIFGGTEKGQGRSKVIIRIPRQKLEISESKPVPHKHFSLSAFRINQEFTVHLCLSENMENIFSAEQLKALFILTCILGGLGKRTRRGMGSIRINKIDGKMFQCQTLNELLNYLNQVNPDKFLFENGLIRSDFKRGENYPYIKQIQLGNKTDNDYLWRISHTTHELKKVNKDYEPSLGYASDKKRFASPVYVSLIKINEELRPIITTLNTVSSKDHPNEKLQEGFRNTILVGWADARKPNKPNQP